jgi:DNA replication protein DnaC
LPNGKAHFLSKDRIALTAEGLSRTTTSSRSHWISGDVRRLLEEQLALLAEPKLLIVDELGNLPSDPNAAHLFFQLVSRRYERGAMLITSNRSVGEWGTMFGDPVVATAILDRLLHHSLVITIRGDSNRLREKRRSELLCENVNEASLLQSRQSLRR